MGGVGRGVNLAVVALAIGWPIASAQAATGLEPGVHVDPGSPAAKEYALPLNQARQTGSGAPSQPGTESTLFGVGIKPPGSGGPGAAGKGPHGGHSPGGHVAQGAGASAQTGAPSATSGASLGSSTEAVLSAAALRAARAQGPTGDGSLLALLGGGVVVLVLGGFGGTVLRHNRRPTSP
jgi:hypothetical protein